MTRKLLVATVFAGVGMVGLFQLGGCGTAPEDTSSVMSAEIIACGLDDGSVEHGAKLHACDPQDHKKTTICHIPPGNPANAHTLCIGNAAVPAHLKNHGDYLGVCQNETPCPPPTGAAGAPGGGDSGGGAGGAAGAGTGGGSVAGTSGGGAGGDGMPIIP
jgi:hypothetical protein